MIWRGLLAAAIIALLSPPTYAACTNPAGARGAVAYNDTYSVLQVCDGAIWAAVGGGGATTLALLTDVDAPAAAEGDVLTFNATTSKWEAASPTGDGQGITALTGDVTASGNGSVTATIAANAITSAKILDGTIDNADIASGTIANAKLASMAAGTVKGNNTGSAAAPVDLTMAQLRAILGSGTPDNTTYLRGDGSWQAVPAGTVTGTGLANHIAYWDSASGLAYDANQLAWDAANNRLGIGTATPATALDVKGEVYARRDDAWFNFTAYQYSDTKNATLRLMRSRGTEGAQTHLQSGDIIGAVTFRSAPNASQGSSVMSSATQTHATGAFGSNLQFQTTANNATNPTTRMTISESGNVGIGTTTPKSALHVAGGIQLGDDTATCPGASNIKFGTLRYASNTLSVCNAGGWTALGTGGGGPSSGTSGYVQISGGSGAFAHDSTSGGQLFWDSTNHRLGIGTATPAVSALVDISSTAKGFLPPRMTASQRDAITAPATGLMIFNTTKARPEYYDGSKWMTFAGNGARSDGTSADGAAASCNAIMSDGFSTGSGTYWIDPDGSGGSLPFQSFCDMTTNGGGWTLCGSYSHRKYGSTAAAGFDYLSSTWNTDNTVFMSGSTVQAYGNFCNVMSFTALVAQVRSSTTTVQFTTPVIPASGMPFAAGQDNRFTTTNGYIGIKSRSAYGSDFYANATCSTGSNSFNQGTVLCVGNGTAFQAMIGNINAGSTLGDYACAYNTQCGTGAAQTILLFAK